MDTILFFKCPLCAKRRTEEEEGGGVNTTDYCPAAIFVCVDRSQQDAALWNSHAGMKKRRRRSGVAPPDERENKLYLGTGSVGRRRRVIGRRGVNLTKYSWTV